MHVFWNTRNDTETDDSIKVCADLGWEIVILEDQGSCRRPTLASFVEQVTIHHKR